jgi:hypothetical protein
VYPKIDSLKSIIFTRVVVVKSFPQLVTDNRIFIWFSAISSYYRWAITFIVGLLIVLSWSIFFLIPLFSKIKDKNSQILEQKKLLVTLRKNVDNSRSAQEGSESLRKSLNGIISEGRENISKTLLSLIRESNNYCQFITPKEKDFYKVGINGSFANILVFLDLLAQKNKCAKVNKLFCQRTGNGKVALVLCLEIPKEL